MLKKEGFVRDPWVDRAFCFETESARKEAGLEDMGHHGWSSLEVQQPLALLMDLKMNAKSIAV